MLQVLHLNSHEVTKTSCIQCCCSGNIDSSNHKDVLDETNDRKNQIRIDHDQWGEI